MYRGFRILVVLLLVAFATPPALAIGERIGGILYSPTPTPQALPSTPAPPSAPTLPSRPSPPGIPGTLRETIERLPADVRERVGSLPGEARERVASILAGIPASPLEAPDGLFENASRDLCTPASVTQAVKSAGAKAEKVRATLERARNAIVEEARKGAAEVQSMASELRSRAAEVEELLCGERAGGAKKYTGAVFNAPPSFSDSVAVLRVELSKIVPGGVPKNPFLLLTRDGLFLVLSDAKPVPSLGTVEGKALESKTGRIPLKLPGGGPGLQGAGLGVILAERASFATDGPPATIAQVKGDPKTYDISLVRLDTNLRQVSLILDGSPTPCPECPTWTVTAGMVLDNPVQVAPLAREMVTSADRIAKAQGAVQKTFLGSEDHLLTFNFAEDWWGDVPASVHGVVLSAEKVKQLISALPSGTGGALLADETPILYIVKVEPKPQEVSLADLLSDPKSYDGRVVSFEAPALGFKVSIQETIHLGGDHVSADVVLHGLVAWDAVPSTSGGLVPGGSRIRVLPVLAANNEHFELPAGGVIGRYRFVGKVITAGAMVEGLRGEPVLLQYRREKTGDLDLSQVAAEVRAQVEQEAQAILAMVKGLGAISGSASLSVGAAGGSASVSVAVEPPPGSTPTPKRVAIGDASPPRETPGFGVLLGLAALMAVALSKRRR